ncbi:hypothetical protein [Bacteroides caecimuris]|uniref:hypothetical protein n=1 Tax=Bacteroides caecimuris TaxID=1796613 RepID=UPI00243186EF|nr:hypothetical protein [Bacteroides caecimuris]
MRQWQQIIGVVGLLLIEVMIMLYAVPKANANEIDTRVWLVIELSLALLISLAILIKENWDDFIKEFLREDINNAYIQLIEFSLLSEIVLEWDDGDLEH